MNFTPLFEKEEIEIAFHSFYNNIIKHSEPFIGTRNDPGSKEKNTQLFWIKPLGIWSYFYSSETDDRHWSGFGLRDSDTNIFNLTQTCEINFMKEGKSRVAGLFLRDNEENTYVTHNGDIRVNRQHVRSLFIENVQQNRIFEIVDVTSQDGTKSKRVLIGKLDDPKLYEKIAKYINYVDSFKEEIRKHKRTI